MPKNQLSFFATKADLESLLKSVESERALQFVPAGLFDSSRIEPRQSLLDVANLDGLAVDHTNHQPRYLISDLGIPIEVRPVAQRTGEIKYAVDQLANPKTVALQPGGAFGESCLIAGQMGTASDEASSLELFQSFSKRIWHQFAKVKSFYVGKEAGELLDKGWRLTTNAKSPATYDLKRD
ncbi:hypothetical protein [Bradyrhizobium sp. 170]|uniref:hypothetical protein n=1 Tax=Bradyrhizobium sp. 170 TaxID=2782641 RepID=UPI00200056E8|nr:hypothetical protein [Bradyrhizobium sp. 170]UPK06938.1 hypothetical protein IVB05_16230 [Bradyrhizobium sp. 170]